MDGATAEFQVGTCLVRPETGEIIRDGETLHLEPKSMAVLAYLIERRGEVVSRDELLDAVWPGVHVSDESLTAGIIKVRRALGDDARHPSYVETIPKRGYRLVADVQPLVPSDPAAIQPRKVKPRWRVAVTAALSVALVVVIAFIFANRTPDETGVQAQRATSAVIAVTPFTNASGDPAQSYLAQGISDTILTDLAQVSDLSVRHFDASNSGAAQGRYILEGSVLREDDVIRITTRLLDAADGKVILALRFDRPFADLLTVQDEIRDTLLVKLERTVSAAEKTRMARGYTDNVAAYDLFLQAQRDLLVRTRETNLEARALFRQAISLDPGFARAYGGLALTYAAAHRNDWDEGDSTSLDSAVSYAKTALEISPDLPQQHWVIGYVRTQQRRYDEALDELHAAMSLDPEFADAFALSGGIETYRGNFASSVPLLREAMRLNPAAGHLYFLLLARAYYFMDEFEQAEINLDEALARNPQNVEAHLYLAATLIHRGRGDDANWEALEVQSIEPNFSLERWQASYPMARGDQLDRLIADLRLAGLS